MVVHPHPLSPVQFPLVLVSPRICHPDEKSFRRLNQGRFSRGCLPPLTPPPSTAFPDPGSPCSSPRNLGGAVGARVCLCDVGGVKKYIAVGSEAAGSRRLWDGGMFFVHNSPNPHPTHRHTLSCTYTNTKHITVWCARKHTCKSHAITPETCWSTGERHPSV